ncbi:MAG: 1-acyl-sn-glycerol-3-phosphate acyltransferase [Deltaproteobacteria bacterium]|nr:1-acyl-sn-glycerol-3-phosphate acyltransferase [Deltaproteobacteria bacterium]
MNIFKFWLKMVTAFAVMLSATAVCNIIVLVLFPFRKKIGPKLMQSIAKMVLLIFRIKVNLDHMPDILKNNHKGVLIISNHCCSLDIPILAATFGSLFVSKMSVLYWPMIGTFARLSGVIFLRRDKMGERLSMIRNLARHIEPGMVIGVFPQGTTASNKTRLPFFAGVFKVVELNPNISMLPISLDYENNDQIAWENEPLYDNTMRICAFNRINVNITAHPVLTIQDFVENGARNVSKTVEQTVLSALR